MEAHRFYEMLASPGVNQLELVDQGVDAGEAVGDRLKQEFPGPSLESSLGGPGMGDQGERGSTIPEHYADISGGGARSPSWHFLNLK